MKELVASRVPPGDRWALIESESDIVYGINHHNFLSMLKKVKYTLKMV